jgi:hypothetical protein
MNGHLRQVMHLAARDVRLVEQDFHDMLPNVLALRK